MQNTDQLDPFQPLTSAALYYFEQARSLRSETQPEDAEFQVLHTRAKRLHHQLKLLGQHICLRLQEIRPDLTLYLPSLPSKRLPATLSFQLHREGTPVQEDALLYFLLREEGAEVGFGFGIRKTQSHEAIRSKFTKQFQRQHRKARRYVESLLQRDYRLWPQPNQPTGTPSQTQEEWQQDVGAVVRLLEPGTLIMQQQQLVGVVAQVMHELLGFYSFLDRVVSGVPKIRALHIESPDDIDSIPLETDIHDLQAVGRESLLDFLAYAKGHQLHFPADLVRTYMLSLQTRPVVILSGVAGTGKSKLATLFAQFLTEDAQTEWGNPHLAFVPVRPDWLDPQALLGYYDTLSHVYRATPFLLLLLRAAQDPDAPYFVVLDEMNLARIEHYFSDFLSLLESRSYGANGECLSEGHLQLHQEPGSLVLNDPFVETVTLPPSLAIPPNVYFTGTINVDETTHRLSPRLLDRVNLIEVESPKPSDVLSYRHSTNTSGLPRSAASAAQQRSVFARHGRFTAPCPAVQSRLSQEQVELLSVWLDDLFAMLQEGGVKIGIRWVQEVLDFAEHTATLYAPEPPPLAWVLDRQMLQKVLPRLKGTRQQLDSLLVRLLGFCWPQRADLSSSRAYRKQRRQQLPEPQELERQRQIALGLEEGPLPDLPASARKLANILTTLQTEPYVDFHTS